MQEVSNAFPENIIDFIIYKNMPLHLLNKSLEKRVSTMLWNMNCHTSIL